jgi:hypothetical protein
MKHRGYVLRRLIDDLYPTSKSIAPSKSQLNQVTHPTYNCIIKHLYKNNYITRTLHKLRISKDSNLANARNSFHKRFERLAYATRWVRSIFCGWQRQTRSRHRRDAMQHRQTSNNKLTKQREGNGRNWNYLVKSIIHTRKWKRRRITVVRSRLRVDGKARAACWP